MPLLVEAGDVEPETAGNGLSRNRRSRCSMRASHRANSTPTQPERAAGRDRAGVVAPLDRVDGTWVFWHHDRLRPGSVDPDLLPGVSTLDSLCRNPAAVVAGRVAISRGRRQGEPLRRGPRHADLSAGLELPERLRVAIETEGELAAMVRGDAAVLMCPTRMDPRPPRRHRPHEGIEVKDLSTNCVPQATPTPRDLCRPRGLP